MPKVSVLMPNYNAGPRRAVRCVRSVLGQTFSDFEFIIADDGSTDGSLEAISAAAHGDPRVRILDKGAHSGSIAARLRALAAAEGEFVYMIDSDDFLEPDALAVLTDTAAQAGADMAVMNFRYYLSRVRRGITVALPSSRIHPPVGRHAGGWLTNAYFGSHGILPNLWDKLVRRSCFSVPDSLPSIFLGEDTLISLMFAPRVSKVAITDYCGYSWRTTGGSTDWVCRRWPDYRLFHSLLWKMASEFESDGYSARSLRASRADATMLALTRRLASLTLLHPGPRSSILRLLAGELTDPIWDEVRRTIESRGTESFRCRTFAAALLSGDNAAICGDVIAYRRRYYKSMLLDKFSRYV